MAHRRSRLLTFLRRGLAEQRYPNLIFEDASSLTFNITFTHRARTLNEHEQIYEDWYEQNHGGRLKSHHYRNAKAAFRFSLKNSDFVEIISRHRDKYSEKYTCRLLNEEEGRERRRLRREKRHQRIRSIDASAEPEHVANFEQMDGFWELLMQGGNVNP